MNTIKKFSNSFLQPMSIDRLLGILLVLIALISLGSLLNPLKPGLTVMYYDNPGWTGTPVMTDRDATFALHAAQRLLPPLSREYSVSWTGAIFIARPGDYHFTLESDDGSELHINDQLVVDNRGLHGLQARNGTIRLDEGFHRIRLHYMQGQGLAVFRAFWITPEHEQQPLATAPLYSRPVTTSRWLLSRMISLLILVSKGFLIFWLFLFLSLLYRHLPHIRKSLLNAVILLGIFLLIVLVHWRYSPIATPFDSKWTLYTALSLLQEGDTDLDEYSHIVANHRDQSIETVNGHLYSVYPPGTALLVLPVTLIIDTFLEHSLAIHLEQVIHGHLEIFMAAGIVALTALFIYVMFCTLGARREQALGLTLIFAFCTSAWSTASRALWQHGPSMLLLACSLYLLLSLERYPYSARWRCRIGSVFLFFSFLVRPTNAIPIVLLTLYCCVRHKKYLGAFCLWGLLVIVPFVLFSLHVYHALLPPYYLPGSQFGNTPFYYIPETNSMLPPFLEALLGHCISPSRGLFIFSPVLLFALYGIWLKIREKAMNLLDWTLITILCLHWLVIASFPVWWAGHSYGSRYFTDVLPYFIYFLLPFLQHLHNVSSKKRRILSALFITTMLISGFIHYRGATSWEVYRWNAEPTPVETKLWDWRNPQFLHGLCEEEPSEDLRL